MLLRGFSLRNWGLVYASLVVMVVLAIVADLLLVLAGGCSHPWSAAQAA